MRSFTGDHRYARDTTAVRQVESSLFNRFLKLADVRGMVSADGYAAEDASMR